MVDNVRPWSTAVDHGHMQLVHGHHHGIWRSTMNYLGRPSNTMVTMVDHGRSRSSFRLGNLLDGSNWFWTDGNLKFRILLTPSHYYLYVHYTYEMCVAFTYACTLRILVYWKAHLDWIVCMHVRALYKIKKLPVTLFMDINSYICKPVELYCVTSNKQQNSHMTPI